MRIKYESRWKLEELKLEICRSIDSLIDEYHIEYAMGINLYMNCEDKSLIPLILSMKMERILCLSLATMKKYKNQKKCEEKIPAPVIELDKYRKK